MLSIRKKLRNYLVLRKDRKWINEMKSIQNSIINDPRRIEGIHKFQLSEKQKHEIDKFYIENYGEKIDYLCHQTYTAYSGKFDVRYIPETIYIPELEHFLNINDNYCKVLEDKNVMSHLAKSIGISVPQDIAKCMQGLIITENGNIINKNVLADIISKEEKVFAKPTTGSGGGRNCFIIDDKDINVINKKLDLLGEDYVIQRCLKCSTTIHNIYPHSVNTFRVMTYRWKNDIYVCPVIMRIGCGGMEIDNASAGGIFIGINNDGLLKGYAINEYGQRYDKHPDTLVYFDGYKIKNFNRILIAAKSLHANLPQIGIASWDLTINENEEPTLIEANLDYGSPWLIHMTHGTSLFGDKTAEILRWVRDMKKIDAHERYNKKFGF